MRRWGFDFLNMLEDGWSGGGGGVWVWAGHRVVTPSWTSLSFCSRFLYLEDGRW